MTESRPLLEARGLTKAYGHVEALRGADFILREGEIVGLVGDNGAGKSTLVRMLSGVEQPDTGEIRFAGVPVTFRTPQDARDIGIETVYQDLALADDLDAAANLFLGRERVRSGPLGLLGVLDKRGMREEAEARFRALNVRIPRSDAPVAVMSGGQRQGVAVARAVAWATRVVFMDEPTAALGVVQTEQVLRVIRRVREAGVAVVLISHNMPEVLAVCDRVQVLRLGARVADLASRETTTDQLVGAMTGGLPDASAADG